MYVPIDHALTVVTVLNGRGSWNLAKRLNEAREEGREYRLSEAEAEVVVDALADTQSLMARQYDGGGYGDRIQEAFDALVVGAL